MQVARGARDDGDAVGVDVAVARHRGRDHRGPVQRSDEGREPARAGAPGHAGQQAGP